MRHRDNKSDNGRREVYPEPATDKRSEPERDGLSPQLLEAVLSVADADGLKRLLEEHPEIGNPEVQADLRELAEVPGYGATFERLITLFRDALVDPEAAWAAYVSAMAEAEEVGREIEREMSEINGAGERRDYGKVIDLVDAAIPKASAAGLGIVVALLRERRALALLNRPSTSRDEDIETAIADFQEALALSLPGAQQANVLMHFALAFIERVRGDPAENLEQAIGLLRSALDLVEREDDAELQAIVRTNLAMALVRRERGSRTNNLSEAARLCRSALTYRSVERNPVDWAYSQLNYGEVLELLVEHGEATEEAAQDAREVVIDEERRIGEKWLVGAAHHAIGRAHLRAAHPDPEEIVDAADDGFEALNADKRLEAALHHLEAATRYMADCPDPLRPARVLADLSSAYEGLEDFDAAIEIGMQALAVLRPNVAPQACVEVAASIGNLLSQRGEWRAASAAYRDAVEAADLAFHARLETEARQREAKRLGNVSRWAAFAFARDGHGMRAAVVLENGRARELQRRLGLHATDEARLAELPPDLREAYLNSLSRLRLSPWEGASSAGRELQEILAAIRSRPGFARFATGIAEEDFAGAVEAAFPLIYIDPTPYGTLLLTVRATENGVGVDSEFLDYPLALDVFMRLMAGVDADVVDPDQSSLTSYLGGISGEAQVEIDFKLDLATLLPWLGESIAKPVRDILVRLGAEGATLVLCGPIGLAPVHAGSWEEGGRNRCLLDAFDIRYAPSAGLCAASMRRSATRSATTPMLVALGDPTRDLAAAGPETMEIARLFGESQTLSAIGASATRAFLQANAARATHLHLAGHAAASLFAPDEAALFLADGPVSAGELTGLGDLTARLVTISACQSALSSMTDLDEAFSIGTAMLVAGSACAVAALWLVDDLATAYVMTRLYEEMLLYGRRPPEALRRAQLWLRDLSEEEEAMFLSAHPSLASEVRRRIAVRRVRSHLPPDASPQGGRFAHPHYWGAFVAVGA